MKPSTELIKQVESRLKSCPWCSSPAGIKTVDDLYHVVCTGCGVEVRENRYKTDNPVETIGLAGLAWNDYVDCFD